MKTKQLTKGEQTRTKILERVNTFYNEQGVDHTIARIAEETGMGKSRMTNYFPKKEHLIFSLLVQYEKLLASLMSKHQYDKGISDFQQFIPLMSDIIDLMFKYRGVISYAMVNPGMDHEIFKHLKENYADNKDRIRNRLNNFIRHGLIRKDLLDPDTFEDYYFQYMCISSSWIISHNLLEAEKPLETVRPRYIRSIMCCMKPYLTEKGRANMEAALDKLNQIQTQD